MVEEFYKASLLPDVARLLDPSVPLPPWKEWLGNLDRFSGMADSQMWTKLGRPIEHGRLITTV